MAGFKNLSQSKFGKKVPKAVNASISGRLDKKLPRCNALKHSVFAPVQHCIQVRQHVSSQ
nr:hypothetical protein [Roseovarius sp. W115]